MTLVVVLGEMQKFSICSAFEFRPQLAALHAYQMQQACIGSCVYLR